MRASMMMSVVAVVALIFGFAARMASAHDFVVDQQALISPSYSIASMQFNVVGQEFVPQLPALDVVELTISPGTNPQANSTVAVRIHSVNIEGEVLGTSNEVLLPYPTPTGVVHFDFSSPVPLSPGSVYFIEPFIVSGAGNASLVGGSDVYPLGRSWINDAFSSSIDWWFREGVSLPTPTRSSTWGRVKALFR